jgi:hypothetical protein
MPQQTKDSRSTMASAPANQASGQMGLLVGTDDEKEARREAEELCSSFGGRAKILFIRKVVIQ